MLLNKFIIRFLVFGFWFLSTSILHAQSLSNRFNPENNNINEKKWVDSVFKTLTPRERVAQLFMIAAYSNLGEKHVQGVKDAIEKHKVGGLIFFQGTVEKQIELTNTYQTLSKVPLIIGMDAEWGVGMRLDGVLDFPRQMTLGAIKDEQLIYELGVEMGRQCNLLGVHINFSPSVDVNNNSNNPVINSRSFGENPIEVGRKAWYIAKGMQDNKVLACAKHFPGHGDTDKDSHHELPEVTHNRIRLDSIELKPFRQLIDSGVAMVMVGHLCVNALETQPNTPASISHDIITNLLKTDMGFKGLVISDALNMKGLKDHSKGENITIAALKAGHDILLMPDKIADNIAAIEKAIKDNILRQTDIDISCRKILTAKYRVGLNKKNKLEAKNIKSKINSNYAKALKSRLVENSITLITNKNELLPLKNLDKQKIAYIAIGGVAKGKTFANQLSKYTKVDAFSLNTKASKTEMDSLRNKLKAYQILIVGYHDTDGRPSKDYGVEQPIMNYINSLGSDKCNIVFTYFGSPYFLAKLNSPASALDAIIIGFDNTQQSQQCVAQMIFGGMRFKGKLPVTPSSQFPEGFGIETLSTTRLSYVIPEEIGLNSDLLNRVDSLAEILIKEKGAPGCQIIAVHKGCVFYSKAFGSHTYLKNASPVLITDVYDLASVTKVSACLPIIMKLVDEKKIDLKKQLKDYIDLPAQSDKRNIVVRDLLLHETGLQAWMPFHLQFFKTKDDAPIFANKKSSTYSIQLPGTKRFLNETAQLDKSLFASSQSILFPNVLAASIYTSKNVRNIIYSRIDSSKLMDKKYRYSDLGFIYLQRIAESVYKKDLNQLSQELFFAPLGMDNTGYLPRTRTDINCIPPTENDKVFRKQVVHAYPHDQGAALLGGISGHAGLFANANDLAKLYQMILNKGWYGGQQYISANVVELFTSQGKKGSRRGLGFDKPEPDSKKKSPISEDASLSSYGHTGYTGTMVWVDPDRELVYVFLSNRIHPSTENNILSRLGTRAEIFAQLIKVVDAKKKQK